MSLGPAPFEQLERGYCTICHMMKFHVTHCVCAQCRETTLAEQDWCEETVRYVAPSSNKTLRERCEALVKAGATGVAADSREIVATWHNEESGI